MKIALIAAIDEASGLGYKQKLLCHLPKDLQHFKALTMGKTILMGRKTHEAIGRILPDRRNVVLSRSISPQDKRGVTGLEWFQDLPSVWRALEGEGENFVIGGADLYAQLLPLADTLYLTRIHHYFEADAFFPPLDFGCWSCVSSETHPADSRHEYSFTFLQYTRVP